MTLLYFAYGSNMDAEQMARRCPGAVPAGTAVLPGYRFLINERGYATVVPAEDGETPGLLWRLDAGHTAALDRYEGHGKGLYDRCWREVRAADGAQTDALVYIDHRNKRVGAAKPGYLERILAAAEALGLPEAHLSRLRCWPDTSALRAFHRLVGLVRRGGDAPDIARHGAELAQWLKDHRDEVLLEAMEGMPDRTPAERVLVTGTLAVLRVAPTLNEHGAGRLALEHAALGRFLRHAEKLPADGAVPAADKGMAELAGVGVILTADPARAHAPEDRFIVTPHAPLLAAVWHRLFAGDHGVSARDCAFMEAFADAADETPNARGDAVVRLALEKARALAAARRDNIAAELEALRPGNG